MGYGQHSVLVNSRQILRTSVSDAQQRWAHGISLINTINTIREEFDTFEIEPSRRKRWTRWLWSAVKPIALHTVSEIARSEINLPISAIAEFNYDAMEFILLGATSVQVRTAAMH